MQAAMRSDFSLYAILEPDPEPSIKYVLRRAVCGMLYADDACIRDRRWGSLR